MSTVPHSADGRVWALADGNRIPMLALGVWQVPNGPECANAGIPLTCRLGGSSCIAPSHGSGNLWNISHSPLSGARVSHPLPTDALPHPPGSRVSKCFELELLVLGPSSQHEVLLRSGPSDPRTCGESDLVPPPATNVGGMIPTIPPRGCRWGTDVRLGSWRGRNGYDSLNDLPE